MRLRPSCRFDRVGKVARRQGRHVISRGRRLCPPYNATLRTAAGKPEPFGGDSTL